MIFLVLPPPLSAFLLPVHHLHHLQPEKDPRESREAEQEGDGEEDEGGKTEELLLRVVRPEHEDDQGEEEQGDQAEQLGGAQQSLIIVLKLHVHCTVHALQISCHISFVWFILFPCLHLDHLPSNREL